MFFGRSRRFSRLMHLLPAPTALAPSSVRIPELISFGRTSKAPSGRLHFLAPATCFPGHRNAGSPLGSAQLHVAPVVQASRHCRTGTDSLVARLCNHRGNPCRMCTYGKRGVGGRGRHSSTESLTLLSVAAAGFAASATACGSAVRWLPATRVQGTDYGGGRLRSYFLSVGETPEAGSP